MALERKFIEDNIHRFEVVEFLHKELEKTGCGEVEVQRTPIGTRVVVWVQRPGLVIGRKGQAIRKLTAILKSRFGLDNPQIEVQELEVPELNPQVMARSIAAALERGTHFRKAGYTALHRIMDAGARGAEITISGKLTGERAKTVKFVDGYLKHCGEPAMQFVKVGYAIASPKPGVIGVKVKIMPPGTRLPDDVVYKEVPEKQEAEAGEAESGEAQQEQEAVAGEQRVEQEEKKEESEGANAAASESEQSGAQEAGGEQHAEAEKAEKQEVKQDGDNQGE
ncbi:MAG: 30S ribosomal protein S3 [Euryarchaeota archaeon]|nr:30S ribosomal protein S3 [Euryarchaeota archaeon]